MNAEFNKMRTDLANNFASAGAALLDYMTIDGTKTAALAAIPETDPQQYAIAGTLAGIAQMLPKAVPVSEDEQPKPSDLAQQLRDIADASESGAYMPNRAKMLRAAADWIAKNVPGVEAMVAAPVLAGLTRYSGKDICQVYVLEQEGQFFEAEDVEHLFARLAATTQASTAQAEPEYELHQDDMMVAGTSGKDAWREIQHYAAQYEQDGPVEIYEVTRRKVTASDTGEQADGGAHG